MAYTVLFVDDEAPLRDLIHAYLSAEGYEVTTAEDGSQAIALLGERSFDVVLLDLHMPNVDGLEVLRFMKNLNFSPRTFIMSGDDRPFVMTLCDRFGIEGHLPKPLDFDDLSAMLRQVRVA